MLAIAHCQKYYDPKKYQSSASKEQEKGRQERDISPGKWVATATTAPAAAIFWIDLVGLIVLLFTFTLLVVERFAFVMITFMSDFA